MNRTQYSSVLFVHRALVHSLVRRCQNCNESLSVFLCPFILMPRLVFRAYLYNKYRLRFWCSCACASVLYCAVLWVHKFYIGTVYVMLYVCCACARVLFFSSVVSIETNKNKIQRNHIRTWKTRLAQDTKTVLYSTH